MEHVAFTIENALKLYGINGKGEAWLALDQWREAIKRSGYIESEIFMAVTKKKLAT
jgi:hypothetical protein